MRFYAPKLLICLFTFANMTADYFAPANLSIIQFIAYCLYLAQVGLIYKSLSQVAKSQMEPNFRLLVLTKIVFITLGMILIILGAEHMQANYPCAFVALHSLVNLYVWLFAFFYSPKNTASKSSIDFKTKKKIQNAFYPEEFELEMQ